MDRLSSKGIGENVRGFSRDFVEFLSARSDQLDMRRLALTNKDYQEACDAMDSILDEVKDKLGGKTVVRLDDAISNVVIMNTSLVYKIGFTEGVKMIIHSLGA
jgi:hypothetical protein